jgi:hypothetical protein
MPDHAKLGPAQERALLMLAIHKDLSIVVDLGFAGVSAISLMRLEERGLIRNNLHRCELTDAGRNHAEALAG